MYLEDGVIVEREFIVEYLSLISKGQAYAKLLPIIKK